MSLGQRLALFVVVAEHLPEVEIRFVEDAVEPPADKARADVVESLEARLAARVQHVRRRVRQAPDGLGGQWRPPRLHQAHGAIDGTIGEQARQQRRAEEARKSGEEQDRHVARLVATAVAVGRVATKQQVEREDEGAAEEGVEPTAPCGQTCARCAAGR